MAVKKGLTQNTGTEEPGHKNARLTIVLGVNV